jgi:hypothetical protein
MYTAKVGYPRIKIRGSEGMPMTAEMGNKLARLIPEATLSDKLDPKLDSSSQRRIGDQLRAMYDELMQQPVPDRFKDLLEQLEKSNRSRADETGKGQAEGPQ